jgi:alanine-glyoxylate transaminase/serine-glyoxylate transaminase/serine-pyruvate transaminase
MVAKSGRHFLQIPGPTNVPDRILRAMAQPTIDHRGPEFARLGKQVLEGLRPIFKTSGPVVIYPGSGTGAWEAALVNTLSPGDRVLMFETGQFATLWRDVAATGAPASTRRSSRRSSPRTGATRSRRWRWSTTRPPRA